MRLDLITLESLEPRQAHKADNPTPPFAHTSKEDEISDAELDELIKRVTA